ncbi:glycoside hydrolase [Ephemerocybe angulata]|uniref:cellulase n=1 Tax=Ephemerocybe angulata TaxID=980116 RepID=A0A8H6I3L4_9AGAR|nr:glycoside hydrolase [Tulosesus angulatus]
MIAVLAFFCGRLHTFSGSTTYQWSSGTVSVLLFGLDTTLNFTYPWPSGKSSGLSRFAAKMHPICENATKFKYAGVNQAGAEFGNNVIPGSLGNSLHLACPKVCDGSSSFYLQAQIPRHSSIGYFVKEGFNTFRVPFQQERLSPPETGIDGPFEPVYLAGLKQTVDYITNTKGAYAAIEPHNFMIYNGSFITDAEALAKFWTNVATEFKDNDKVIFDIMNEPHTQEAKIVFELNQASVNAIREAGATTQLILVEGTAWTGAWTWTGYSGNGLVFGAITDPYNNTAIEMHQYLDSDGSGTSPVCVSPTIGVERISDATRWLKEHNLKGFLGELGAGSNPDCIAAVKGALCHLQQSDVWIGEREMFLLSIRRVSHNPSSQVLQWWSAGPWWGDYFQSIEPPNGPALAELYPQAIKPFL